MKRKALALILAVLMIVPAMAFIANADNWNQSQYLSDQTGATGTAKFTASAVNAGATAFGQPANSLLTIADAIRPNYDQTYPSLAGAILMGDPAYWVCSLLGNDYVGMQTVAPRMQIAANFTSAINGYNEIHPLRTAAGNCYGFDNWGPTMISYAFSTDPIPAVNTGETDDVYGYIVYDPDVEDAPDIGSASGLIQNGFVFTLSSEGKVANTDSGLGRLVQATKVSAALYENGEIIAFYEAPVTNNQALYTKLEDYGSSGPIFNNVNFDGQSISFQIGDGYGWGINTYSFSAATGDGWDNIERLSPYQDFYKSILVGSSAEVSDTPYDTHENMNWGASSFILAKFNDAAPADAEPTGNAGPAGALADAVKSYVDDNVDKNTLGLAATAGQVNETTKGMRLFFEVADTVTGPIYTATSEAESYLGGITYGGASVSATVSEVGIMYGKDTRTESTNWRQKLTLGDDFATVVSDKEDHGALIKKAVFTNGAQTGVLYGHPTGKYTFTGMINNISAANLNSVYNMREYAVVAVDGVPYKKYYTASYAHHNFYNRAAEGGAWTTAKTFS